MSSVHSEARTLAATVREKVAAGSIDGSTLPDIDAIALEKLRAGCELLISLAHRLPEALAVEAWTEISAIQARLVASSEDAAALAKLEEDIAGFHDKMEAWNVLMSHERDSGSAAKRFVEWISPYKEVIGIAIATSIALSYFATQSELSKQVKFLLCHHSARTGLLDARNEVENTEDLLALVTSSGPPQRIAAVTTDLAHARQRLYRAEEAVDKLTAYSAGDKCPYE